MPSDARKKLIEAMAAEIAEALTNAGIDVPPPGADWDLDGREREQQRAVVSAATVALDALLAALPGMGLAVVPVEMTRDMAWALDLAEMDIGTNDAPGLLLGWGPSWKAAVSEAPNVLGGSDAE